jgi:predicted enzyme related to lactoylglutathione lyase
MVVRTVVHFEIPANDVGNLSNFYSQVFGWKFEKAPMPGFDYWLISTGPRGKSVGGGMYKKEGQDEKPRNFIGVENIDAAIQEFKGAGGTEVAGKAEVPGQGWTFIGADPEGNMIALWQQVPQRPAQRAARRPRRAAKKGKKPKSRR